MNIGKVNNTPRVQPQPKQPPPKKAPETDVENGAEKLKNPPNIAPNTAEKKKGEGGLDIYV